jgi:sugar lactone lactonase YvrE
MRKPPLEPTAWRPPKAPARAKRRHGPVPVELRVFDLPGRGPEDVTVDDGGNAIVGVADGRILRVTPDGQSVDLVGDTEGRPLGVELDPGGDVLVCDARRGVLSVEASSGKVRSLVDRVGGALMMFCNNSAVGRDGTVYFTDSSTRFGLDHYRGELLAHTGTGRLLRRAPDGGVDVLLDGMQFANGVALAPDEASVVVAEMGCYRLIRLWLSGERQGERDVLVDNLPGFPDNISTGSDGLVWVALPSPRNPMLDALLPLPPVLRRITWRVPERLQPRQRTTVWVQAYDANGVLVHDLQTDHPWFHMVTGVHEANGTVWLGSLISPGLGRITLGGRS